MFRQTGICKASINWILKTTKLESYVPNVLHVVTEDDPDSIRRFLRSVNKYAEFIDTIISLIWQPSSQWYI